MTATSQSDMTTPRSADLGYHLEWIVSAPFCVVNFAFKAQLFPAEVRGTRLSVNNSLSTLLFVGLSSVLVTWLDVGIRLAPAHYLAVTSALSIAGLLFIRRDMLYGIRSKFGLKFMRGTIIAEPLHPAPDFLTSGLQQSTAKEH